MRKIVSVLAAVVFVLITPAVSQAQPQSERSKANIVGTWVGSNSGFELGVFVDRQVRYTISSMNKQTFTGNKSWRQNNGEWSNTEAIQGVLLKSGQFMTVDEDGIFIGKLVSRNRISGTYLEVGSDAAALVTTLTRQKSSN